MLRSMAYVLDFVETVVWIRPVERFIIAVCY